MKYCTHCGSELVDEAVICPHCGCATERFPQKTSSSGDSALKTLAKVFMIIGCISSAFAFLIPLCWTIPMTVYYFKKTDNNEKIGIGFKICALLFVNTIAGIMMLCDSSNF